jgi:O-glycosyl hydrolase
MMKTLKDTLLLFLIILMAAPLSARGDYTATVDPGTQYQTFEGWGTSLCWFANVLGGAPDPIRNGIADLLFASQGLGLTVVRYNIGGGENPIYHSIQPRALMPGYESASGVYNWTADANQRWFLSAAMQRGAYELEAFSNSPPYWMTNSGSASGSSNGTSDNLNPAYYDAFADYLATVTQHFAQQNILFRDVEPFNEPSAGWWKFGGNQEGCHFDRSTQNTLVSKLGANLAGKGLLATVAASDENSIDDDAASLTSFDATALGYLTKTNTHSYNGSRRVGLWDLANSNGKALWMSEYGDGDGSGMTLSEQILSDMRLMHPTAWVYWQAVDDSSAPGWGLIYSNLNHPTDYSYTINEKYYVMANYSKFIRPGYKLIFCDDGQSLAAYSQATGTLVIVTTNNTSSDAAVTYNLSAFPTISGAITPYRTSATANLARLSPIALSSSRTFVATAPANSVTTYVVRGATYTPTVSAVIKHTAVGAGVNQFNYSGQWKAVNLRSGNLNLSAHVSAQPNASCTIAFSGAQILLYGTTGQGRGIVAMSIDGGPEEECDLYSQLPAARTLTYASPTLPNGPHTLKIRVTGRKNPRSNGAYGYVEEADIVASSTPLTTGAYQLVGRNSGDVADINSASLNWGAAAIQWPDNGGANQLWQFQADGAYYNLINQNSNLLLEVAGASTAGAADVDQWPATGGANQQWSLAPLTGLYHKLYNVNSGQVLNVNGASTTDGASLIQWYDNDAWNSQWMLRRVR